MASSTIVANPVHLSQQALALIAGYISIAASAQALNLAYRAYQNPHIYQA